VGVVITGLRYVGTATYPACPRENVLRRGPKSMDTCAGAVLRMRAAPGGVCEGQARAVSCSMALSLCATIEKMSNAMLLNKSVIKNDF